MNMKANSAGIPDAAMAAIKRGHTIEAIKLIREQTGLGLKEAKDLVDSYIAGESNKIESVGDGELPLQAITLLEAGKLMDAIKATRASLGLGLRDAKERVEQYLDTHPTTKTRFKSITDTERNKVIAVLVVVFAVFAAIYATLKWLQVPS
jgi:ribosomal protein L7/L12